MIVQQSPEILYSPPDGGGGGGEHRSDDSNGTTAMAGMTPWMRFIVMVGVPSAIALYLIWQLTTNFGVQLTAIDKRLEEHEKSAAAVAQHLQLESDQQWALLSVMQRICINTAKTDADKVACTTINKRQ